MSAVDLPVDHVSDTAYLVALYRAYESSQADAKFKDPFAAALAAPKAQWLEERIPFKEEGQWLMTVRTCLLDEHILNLIHEGVDTVVNLASGLDTRPYRLDLPKHVHWIEADFPAMIDYKTQCLAKESPRCRLERLAVDLREDSERQRVFSRFDAKAKQTLVLTEGLLSYLTAPVVNQLALDLLRTRSITHWLMDIMSDNLLQHFKENWKVQQTPSNVSLQFSPTDGPAYFEKVGWKVAAFDSFFQGTEKLGRALPKQIADASATPAIHDSGIALLQRQI